MNRNALRAAIIQHGDTQKDLADYLGIGLATLNGKINGKTDFKYSEMLGIKRKYGLSFHDIAAIFFSDEVS